MTKESCGTCLYFYDVEYQCRRYAPRTPSNGVEALAELIADFITLAIDVKAIPQYWDEVSGRSLRDQLEYQLLKYGHDSFPTVNETDWCGEWKEMIDEGPKV